MTERVSRFSLRERPNLSHSSCESAISDVARNEKVTLGRGRFLIASSFQLNSRGVCAGAIRSFS